MAHFSLDSAGWFTRGGKRIFPVGVNYWPASCGVEMWQAWDEDEIRRDLDLVCGLGLNCVRFFLRWPDFEPSFGRYDETMFRRLAQFAGWCRERDLLAHPALIVGFMSGGYFWPSDKGERNLYADPEVRHASAALCAKAAETLRPFSDTVLALDLGNELDCADASGATADEVRAWCAEMVGAIRSVWPEVLVVSGLDSAPLMRECSWRIDGQPGTDFLSIHNYPVPAWNVVGFDGMADPFCQAILPFNALLARTYGPVMLQEFGTILTCGAAECTAYLDGMLDGCFENGVNGFLWWCLHDISAKVHPYLKTAAEGRLGLVDASGRVKPSLQAGLEKMIALSRADPPVPPEPGECVGLYWPAELYRSPANPGNDVTQVYRRLLAAYHLLRLMGRKACVVRGDRPFPAGLREMVVAGCGVTVGETQALADWVRGGGRLLWSGIDGMHWSEACDDAIGAQAVDLRPARPVTCTMFGRAWTITGHPVTDLRTVARATTADVLAESGDGRPLVLSNRLGAGCCLAVLASPESTVADLGADPAARDAWQAWYEGCFGVLEEA
ncbi:MAG: cellulase family glycosylhydrolase [Kiritimatiellia bacterium]|jgi:hypothetical protein